MFLAVTSGGSGGAGGAGLFLSGASTVTINAGTFGGTGGAGGGTFGAGTGGAGGAGGAGVNASNGATITVNATVRGGLGGDGGPGTVASGARGADGAGIAGSNLSITLGATGSITDADGAGGLAGNALQLSGNSRLTVAAAGTASIIGNIDIASGTLTLDQASGVNVTIANAITGGGALAKVGAGTVTLTGTNTYTGGTTFIAGTLSVSSDANLGHASGGLIFSGASTLQVTGSFTTARAVVLNANATVEVSAGQNFTMGGAIIGTGGVTKTGSGTLTLTGSNSYMGGTTISAGTVSISSDDNLGASGTTVTLNNSTIVGGAGTGADAILRTTATFSSNRNIRLHQRRRADRNRYGHDADADRLDHDHRKRQLHQAGRRHAGTDRRQLGRLQWPHLGQRGHAADRGWRQARQQQRRRARPISATAPTAIVTGLGVELGDLRPDAGRRARIGHAADRGRRLGQDRRRRGNGRHRRRRRRQLGDDHRLGLAMGSATASRSISAIPMPAR